MALAPDSAPWYRRFRMLLGIYVLAMLFGAREFVLARSQPEIDMETAEWSRMADVIAQVNPADVDTDYLLAMEALKKGDRDTFVRHMEAALLDKNAKQITQVDFFVFYVGCRLVHRHFFGSGGH